METPVTDRRTLLLGSAALVAFSALGSQFAFAAAATETAFANAPERKFTDAQWRQKLKAGAVPAQGSAYNVLRHEDTERPGTSPLLAEHRKGTFVCAGCDLPLFKSEWKFESGTGWPSFYDVIKSNIGQKTDHEIAEERTEYHCAKCLGHHGHVFPDGPPPTRLRYCNNGSALKFVPA